MSTTGTPEQRLAALLQKNDRRGLQRFFAGMTEPERRKLLPAVLARQDELDDQSGPGAATRSAARPRKAAPRLRPPPAWDNGKQALRLAQLAIATVTEWCTDSGGLSDDDELEMLATRPAAWRATWAEQAAARSPAVARSVIAAAERGLCPRPQHDNFLLAHLAALRDPFRKQRALIENLRARPQFLRDDLWRLLQVEGLPDCSLAGADQFRKGTMAWTDALCELSADGTVPRQRLLEATLEALARDFVAHRSAWYSNLHDQLAPTAVERRALLQRYLQLLGSTIPSTVGWTIKALTELDKHDALPTDALLEAIEPALMGKAKATVVAALRLLERAAARAPQHRDAIAMLAAGALLHEHADAQGRALQLLDRLHPEPRLAPDELRTAIAAAAPSCKPSVQQSLVRWLDEQPSPPTSDATSRVAVAVAVAGRTPRPLTPITSTAELQLELAAALENADEPMRVERVIDALARFGDQPLELGALAKRAAKLVDRWSDSDDGRMRRNLCRLVLAWHSDEPFVAIGARTDPTAAAFIGATGTRVAECPRRRGESTIHLFATVLTEIARGRGRARVRLATPTDERGWIAADELVRRAAARDGDDPADQALALLRLHPEGRGAARRAAKKLRGEFGDALRHALGVDGVTIGQTASLWLAAARARDPHADDLRVDAAHPEHGPGGARVARRTLTMPRRRFWTFSWFDRSPGLPELIPALHPVVLLNGAERGNDLDDVQPPASGQSTAQVRWTCTIAPGCTEDLFAHGLERIDPDWREVQWEVRWLLEPMLFTDCALGTEAYRLLVAALAAKEAGQHGMAVDVALAALGDERLTAAGLGTALAELLPAGLLVAGRLARSLAEIVRVSPASGRCVLEAVLRGLRGDPAHYPKDLAKLLELTLELCIQLDVRVTDADARAFLAAIGTGGKTRKAAQALLAR